MNEHDPQNFEEQERSTADDAAKERLARERDKSDLCWVMGTKQGRRFMWRFLSRAGLFTSSFNTNNAVMAFNEGNRNAGLQQLTDIMAACPEKYTLMMHESREEKEKNEHRAADRRNKRK